MAAEGAGDERLVIELLADEETEREPLDVELAPTAIGAAAGQLGTHVAGAVRAIAAAGGDHTAGWAPSTEPVREVPSAVTTHHLLGPPTELTVAVERFLDLRRGRVRTSWGTLHLARRRDDRPMLAAWSGRMRLRVSPAAIAVELDVEQWRSIGVMVTLRPVRAHDRRIGAHRRWAWFRACHDALEQLRLAVEAGAAPACRLRAGGRRRRRAGR